MSEEMGYIMSLRKVLGHRPLVMTCAGVLILDENNRLLLQKRADNGLWGYPGGSMEPGESFEACAKREVMEETGLLCRELEFFTTVSGEEGHYTYPNGDEIYAAEVVFLCRTYEGMLYMQKDEVSELKFFSLDALPEITHNNVEPIKRLWKSLKK
ncbi:MAG: NUDIX hydrolase [Lachnospiraceae bacterium]